MIPTLIILFLNKVFKNTAVKQQACDFDFPFSLLVEGELTVFIDLLAEEDLGPGEFIHILNEADKKTSPSEN